MKTVDELYKEFEVKYKKYWDKYEADPAFRAGSNDAVAQGRLSTVYAMLEMMSDLTAEKADLKK